MAEQIENEVFISNLHGLAGGQTAKITKQPLEALVVSFQGLFLLLDEQAVAWHSRWAPRHFWQVAGVTQLLSACLPSA